MRHRGAQIVTLAPVRPDPLLRLVALLLLLFAALLASTVHAAATRPDVELRSGIDENSLDQRIGYFVDANGNASLADVRQALTEGRFRPVERMPPTFGFANGVHWLHVGVSNIDSPERDWIVAISYALLDHVQLDLVRSDGSVVRAESGDRVDFDSRLLRHRDPTFALPLAAGQRADLFLRVETESSVQVPIRILTARTFLAEAPSEYLGLGIYYGIMFGLFLYNLILFSSIRDRTFLYYVVYVGAFALGQCCLNGLAFQYLWPHSPDLANSAVIVTIAIALVAMIAFGNAFLDLARLARWAHRCCQLLATTLVIAAVLYPWIGYRPAILIVTLHVFPVAALLMVAGLQTMALGNRPARNFLLAWVALLAGVVAYAALSFGLLPKMFLTEYGIQIGSAAEMILLSFALAYRIKLLTEENQRLQIAATSELEQRVDLRTRELEDAMTQLRSANQTLRDYSLRDGLTGAHNRRFFDQALSEAWEHCRRNGLPLSLLMADIDLFKQINDRHGHLAGDDCLRAVAQCMTRVLLRHPDERLVRYGGEEFVAILPGADGADVATRGEAVREAVADMAIATEGTQIRLTISVGTATFDPTQELALTDLLRITDRALYDAKHLGRNRVSTRQSQGP